jgi:hypothetical protein
MSKNDEMKFVEAKLGLVKTQSLLVLLRDDRKRPTGEKLTTQIQDVIDVLNPHFVAIGLALDLKSSKAMQA